MSPNHERDFSRRRFLQLSATAALAAPFVTSCSSTGKPATARGRRVFSPGQKLQHACIGVGGMGWNDLQNFKSHPGVQIVALCDVDRRNLEKAQGAVPDATLYVDWRELLEKEGDRIDSANIAVPDHMHFPIAYSAIERGKHVYLQKPMCHDVAEVRRLTEASAKHEVVTQLGTQEASSKNERLAVSWLRAGVIGKVEHIYLCSNRPGAVEHYRLEGPRPPVSDPVPNYLNWNLWLGSAPARPYKADIYHPVKWRAWQDFGTGWSGDIGCHIFDAVWKGLGLQTPRSVFAEVQSSWKTSPQRRGDTWPQGDHITWVFPSNELTAKRELTLEWFDGEFYPPEPIRKRYSADLSEYPSESAMVVGTEGALLIPHAFPPQLLPEDKFKDAARPEFPPRNHYHHFVDACFARERNESHFAQTGPMTEAILLGTVAIRTPNQSLEWDARRCRVQNSEEANAYLRRTYRDGWSVAGF